MMLAQRFSSFPDFSLTRKKHQDIARPHRDQFIHRVENSALPVLFFLVIHTDRAVINVYRIHPAGDFNDRRIVKMPGKALCIDGRRSDNQFEIRPFWQ